MRFAATCILFLSLTLIHSEAVYAKKRFALVIGNSNYEHTSSLKNPVRDATAVAAAFKKLDFFTTLKVDITRQQLQHELKVFGRQSHKAEMAVIYYAGHGMELGGENWLVPVDAQLKVDMEVEDEAISLSYVLRKVRNARRLKLVILDACRNNPLAQKMIIQSGLTRSVPRGLGYIEPEGDVLVAYAAKHGTEAFDGGGKHSPYAEALLKHLLTPGLEINFLFRRVRDSVRFITQNQQTPFIYGSLGREEMFFMPEGYHARLTPDEKAENLLWDKISESNKLDQLNYFINNYPNGSYASVARHRANNIIKDMKGWKLTPQTGHSNTIRATTYSPNGYWLASADDDGLVKLWDNTTGRLIRTIKVYSEIRSIAISPDSQHIAVGTRDNFVKIWSAKNGNILYKLKGHSNDVLSIAFSPNGRQIVSGGIDKSIRLWSVETGRLVKKFDNTSGTIITLAFSSDGKKVYSGDNGMHVKVWDVKTGNASEEIVARKTEQMDSATFSDNLKLFAHASVDTKSIKLWDVKTGKLIHNLSAKCNVRGLSFSPDGNRLISDDCGGKIRIWNTQTGQLIRTFRRYSNHVSTLAFSPDGEKFMSGTSNTLNIWDVTTGKLIREIYGSEIRIASATLSPDNKKIASGALCCLYLLLYHPDRAVWRG